MVTRLGRESGSMIKEMATLGYFLMIATMAEVVSKECNRYHGTLTVNVLCLVHIELTNSKFTVRSLRSTITAREVVDDESSNLVASNVLNGILD